MLKESETPPQSFTTTRWSVVAAAGGPDPQQAREALVVLCNAYWYPLYAYARRRGSHVDEAQDLTQGFFVHLLEHEVLRLADPSRGRFRSFLLTSFQHYIANQHRQQRTIKRGGALAHLSLDFDYGETRYQQEPSHQVTAESIFGRRWAMTVLESAMRELEQEYQQAGKHDLFDALKPVLGGDRVPRGYRELAAELGMTEGAVKVAAHRLRRRCGTLVRDQIAATVHSQEEIDQELHELFVALS